MVIGLGPEYNYVVEDHNIWNQDNTTYASNHGASLISRTLIELFDADYVNDFSDVDSLRATYDLCIISFATHVTSWRDVSRISDFVEHLNIKTVAFSLGIQDNSTSTTEFAVIHPSLKRLIQFCIKKSGYVGVRGPHTKVALVKSGIDFDKIIEIGCPTLYRDLNPDLRVDFNSEFSSPKVVFQRTMAKLNGKILSDVELIGQDYLDEVVFDSTVPASQVMKERVLIDYSNAKNGALTLKNIELNGFFTRDFDNWYNRIGDADFVYGARLHGCITAILQGVPALMLARDIRVVEIAEFFNIPYIKYKDVRDMSKDELFARVDYSEFNSSYKDKLSNFLFLLKEMGVLENLAKNKSVENLEIKKLPTDNSVYFDIMLKEIGSLKKQFSKHNKLYKAFKKIDKKAKNKLKYNRLRRILNI